MTRRLLVIVAFSLAGCTPAPSAKMTTNTTDPAIADALAGPLLTDVQLAVPPPLQQPASLPVPTDARVDTAAAPTLGAVAARRSRDAAFIGCVPDISYTAQWSLKLPIALALPKAARLSEAAGGDHPGCALRIVRFGVAQSPVVVIHSYAAIAAREGFATSKIGTTLSATRIRDGSAFHVDVVANREGALIDLTTRTR